MLLTCIYMYNMYSVCTHSTCGIESALVSICGMMFHLFMIRATVRGLECWTGVAVITLLEINIRWLYMYVCHIPV